MCLKETQKKRRILAIGFFLRWCLTIKRVRWRYISCEKCAKAAGSIFRKYGRSQRLNLKYTLVATTTRPQKHKKWNWNTHCSWLGKSFPIILIDCVHLLHSTKILRDRFVNHWSKSHNTIVIYRIAVGINLARILTSSSVSDEESRCGSVCIFHFSEFVIIPLRYAYMCFCVSTLHWKLSLFVSKQNFPLDYSQ